MGLLCFLGHAIWDDVGAMKSAAITTSTKVDSMAQTVNDHEARIRQTEHDVTILQQEQREDRPLARSPKMIDNNKN